jgi:hypothetical protein
MYLNYFYYHCIQQPTFLKQPYRSTNNIDHKFPFLPSHHTLRYISTAYTSTIDVTLYWADFAKFYELLVSSEELETYAFERYLDLTHFLISWSSHRKHKFKLLKGFEQTPLSAWRLGP